MGVFRQFPYSNFHEMNMDEIIKIVKNMLEEWAQYHAEWDAWMNQMNDDWSNYQEVMNEAWQNMQDFINNYFDNLDVQNEINNKITSMVASGEFSQIVNPYVPPAVSAWLTTHITEPVGVVIDTSLSVSGACADAKVTGDYIRAVESAYINLAKSENIVNLAYENNKKYIDYDDTEQINIYLAHTDYIRIPDNAIAVECGNKIVTDEDTQTIRPNIFFYDADKTLIYYNNSSDYIANYPLVKNAKYIRVNQPAQGEDGESLIRFIFNENSGYMGNPTLTFSTPASTRASLIYLTANTPYTIICNTEIYGKINAYVGSDVTHLVRIFGKGAVEFTPAISGFLNFFNVGGDVTGQVEFEVYESSKVNAKTRRTPTLYEVGPNKAYTSLTSLLYALKDDDSAKTIYVDGGDYDIFQEYTDLGLLSGPEPANPTTDYFDYNVWIPSNTHIIGRGIVRLIWEPTTSDISSAWSKTISPVNVAGSMTLENVEIHCKNGRYCIHDDPKGKAQYVNAHKYYKNVKCYKYTNDTNYGFASVIGFGLGRKSIYEFDGCYFYSEPNLTAFYMHNWASDDLGSLANADSSNVIVKNSIIDTRGSGIGVKFGNVPSSSALRIRVNFEACYIGGWILISDEADNSTGNNPNTYDVTLCRCNTPNILVRDTDNQYPVTQF